MLQRTLFVTWVALVWLWGRAWHPGSGKLYLGQDPVRPHPSGLEVESG